MQPHLSMMMMMSLTVMMISSVAFSVPDPNLTKMTLNWTRTVSRLSCVASSRMFDHLVPDLAHPGSFPDREPSLQRALPAGWHAVRPELRRFASWPWPGAGSRC